MKQTILLNGLKYTLTLLPDEEKKAPSAEESSYIGKKFFYKNSIGNPPPIYVIIGVNIDVNVNSFHIKYKKNFIKLPIKEVIDAFKSGRIIEVEELYGSYKIVEIPKERNFDGIYIKTLADYRGRKSNVYKIEATNGSCRYEYTAIYIDKGFKESNRYDVYMKKDVENWLNKNIWIEITEEEARELTKLTPTPILSLPDGNGGLYHLYEGDSAWKFNFLKDGYYKVIVTKGDIKDAKNIFPTEELAKKRLKQIEKRYSEEDILAAIGTDKTLNFTQASLFRWSIQKSLNFKGYSKWDEKVQD